MTVYFRLLAGLMSRCSRLNRAHFSASGPPGTFGSSFIWEEPPAKPRDGRPGACVASGRLVVRGDELQLDGQHDGAVADQDEQREDEAEHVDRPAEPGVL